MLFRDLLPDLTTHVYSDLDDPMLNTAILAWNARQVPLTEAWWNFPSFAPLTGVTAFTEHLLLTYPIASPVIWLSGNPVLAYNLVFLLALPLNGLAAFALARELTGSRAAAVIAGLAFACAPYQATQLLHLQQMMSFGMPFALLWLHRYFRTGRRRALVWFGVGWLITALANSSLLIFFPLLLLLWGGWFVRPREWRRLIGPVVAVGVASLPLVPLLLGVPRAPDGVRLRARLSGDSKLECRHGGTVGDAPPSRRVARDPAARFRGGCAVSGIHDSRAGRPRIVVAVRRGGGPLDGGPQGPARTSVWPRRLFAAFALLTVIVLARVWTGPWGWHVGPLPLPPFRPYRLFSVAAILLPAGVLLTDAWRRAWSRRDVVLCYAVAVVALWLVALGPEPEWSTPWRALVFGPYRLLMELPGLQSIRVPARAWIPAVLSLAMLAGFGTAAVLRRYPRHARRVLVLLALLIVTEGWSAADIRAVPRPMREGAIPQGAIVMDLPMERDVLAAVAQYRAVVGGYRAVNGYSGYEPGHFYLVRRAIADFEPDALASYRRVADLYVILRPDLAPPIARWIEARPGAEHLVDVDDARIYRLPRFDPVPGPVVDVPATG